MAGYLIATTYTKLSKKRALAEYEEWRAAEMPRLHVLGNG